MILIIKAIITYNQDVSHLIRSGIHPLCALILSGSMRHINRGLIQSYVSQPKLSMVIKLMNLVTVFKTVARFIHLMTIDYNKSV